MMRRHMGLAAILIATTLVLSGCSFTGLNSFSLPFSKGGSSDAVRATVLLENATNLVPNSEVKYREVTVGSVRKITLDGWTAKLTIGLEKDADVPANVTAQVAQKSLLGAEYLELKSPAADDAAGDTSVAMASGAVIGLERTSRYPETEEVLSAATLLLNGGGLPQIQSISREVNSALGGRTETSNSLVREINTTSKALDSQRGSIFTAAEQLRDLSRTLNDNEEIVDKALVSLPKGLEALESDRPALTETLKSFSRIKVSAETALVPNGDDLGEILNNLTPVTQSLVGMGSDLPKALELLTYPFPANAVPGYTRSDYLNLFATFTVSADRLSQAFVGFTPLDGVLSGLMGPPTGAASDSTDPLTAPVDGLAGKVRGLAGSSSKGSGQKSPSNPTPTSTPTQPPNLLNQLFGGTQ